MRGQFIFRQVDDRDAEGRYTYAGVGIIEFYAGQLETERLIDFTMHGKNGVLSAASRPLRETSGAREIAEVLLHNDMRAPANETLNEGGSLITRKTRFTPYHPHMSVYLGAVALKIKEKLSGEKPIRIQRICRKSQSSFHHKQRDPYPASAKWYGIKPGS